MGTLWEWRSRDGGVWEALSLKRPEVFWMQKEYREVAVDEPRFRHIENSKKWPHRFELLGPGTVPHSNKRSVSVSHSHRRVLTEIVYDWCAEQCDASEWFGTHGTFYFRCDAQATLFRLRWC